MHQVEFSIQPSIISSLETHKTLIVTTGAYEDQPEDMQDIDRNQAVKQDIAKLKSEYSTMRNLGSDGEMTTEPPLRNVYT